MSDIGCSKTSVERLWKGQWKVVKGSDKGYKIVLKHRVGHNPFSRSIILTCTISPITVGRCAERF